MPISRTTFFQPLKSFRVSFFTSLCGHSKAGADLMARAEYIERMRTVIKKMRDLVKAEGLPPIKFEFDNYNIL